MILAVLLHFTLPPASAGYIVSLLLCRVYVSVAHSWAAGEKLFFCCLFETDRCEYIVEDLKKKNLICCSLVCSMMRSPAVGWHLTVVTNWSFFIIQKRSQGCIWFLSLIMEWVKDVIVWQLIKGHSGAGYLPLVLLFTCSVFDPRLTLLLALSSICWSSPVKSLWMWFLPGLLSHL